MYKKLFNRKMFFEEHDIRGLQTRANLYPRESPENPGDAKGAKSKNLKDLKLVSTPIDTSTSSIQPTAYNSSWIKMLVI